MKNQSKTVEIIFLPKKNNAKSRAYEKFSEILSRNHAEREFNQKLKKAFWRHENPRQNLIDFQQKIAIYTSVFTQSRKKQKKQSLIKQKALYH